VSEGEIEAFGSVELIQEVAFHHLRRTQDRHAAAAAARDVMSLVRILDFDRAVLEEALRLIEAGSVRGRDAIHAATALAHSLDTIVTPDSDFDGIPGLRRLDPQDAARQWGSSL
jgi:predicted nucleic acid-binding protein